MSTKGNQEKLVTCSQQSFLPLTQNLNNADLDLNMSDRNNFSLIDQRQEEVEFGFDETDPNQIGGHSDFQAFLSSRLIAPVDQNNHTQSMTSLNLDISLLNNLVEQSQNSLEQGEPTLDRRNIRQSTPDDPTNQQPKKTSFKIRAPPSTLQPFHTQNQNLFHQPQIIDQQPSQQSSSFNRHSGNSNDLEVRFAKEPIVFEKDEIFPAKRNCKSSSRQSKSIVTPGQVKSGTAQVFIPHLVGLNKLPQFNQQQQHGLPLTEGRHNPYSSSQQQQEQLSALMALRNQNQVTQQTLQQKLQINLKNLNATSGGSNGSISNKDLSERIMGIQNQLTQTQQYTQAYPQIGRLTANMLGDTVESGKVLILQNTVSITSNTIIPNKIQTNDPYFYLQQMRQQKHKSSRSAYPADSAHHFVQKMTNDPRSMRTNQGARSSSSNSFSSNTTAIKSLSEVKNPTSLICFRFVNRGVSTLNEIQKFRNLTELDVSGNQLRSEVPELLKLTFLKKLSIANNQIDQMWPLPINLEFLNISQNKLERFEPRLLESLSSLKILDASRNYLVTLDGVQHMTRLKRLIAFGNQISDLQPIFDLTMIVELDLESNRIENNLQLEAAIIKKKDLLVFNLKQNPVTHSAKSPEDLLGTSPELFAMMSHYQSGVLYKNKRVYGRVRQQLSSSQIPTKRSISNFSQESQNGYPAFSQLQPKRRLLSAASPQSTGTMPTRHDEAIDLLFDKILEDEDKILLAEKRRLKRLNNANSSQSSDSCSQEVEDLCSSDDDDISINSEQDIIDVDGEEPNTFREDEEEPLVEASNYESTADFNKEIKELRRELIAEGKINPITGMLVSEREDSQNFDIQVQMPAPKQLFDQAKHQQKPKTSFKLDLSKCSNVEESIQTVDFVDHEQDIMLNFEQSSSERRSMLVCTPKKSKRDEDSSSIQHQSPKQQQVHIVRRQTTQQQNSVALKTVLIPRLALQNIQIQLQPEQQASGVVGGGELNSQSVETGVQKQQSSRPKQNLKILLSKRSQQNATTTQQDQVVVAQIPVVVVERQQQRSNNQAPTKDKISSIDVLRHQKSQEANNLQQELDYYKILISQIKQVCFGSVELLDKDIVPLIQKKNLETEQLQMQNEDLQSQIYRIHQKIQALQSAQVVKLRHTSQRDSKTNYETQILDFYQKQASSKHLLLTNRVPSNDQLTGRIKSLKSDSCNNFLSSRAKRGGGRDKTDSVIIQDRLGGGVSQINNSITDSAPIELENSSKLAAAKKRVLQQLKLPLNPTSAVLSRDQPSLLVPLYPQHSNQLTPHINIEQDYHISHNQNRQPSLREYTISGESQLVASRDKQQYYATNTARSGTNTNMNETARTIPASEVTQKLMIEYFSQLRERNSSLQERLNQSFKGTRLESRPLTQMKDVLKTDRDRHSALRGKLLQPKPSIKHSSVTDQWQPLQKFYQATEALSQLSQQNTNQPNVQTSQLDVVADAGQAQVITNSSASIIGGKKKRPSQSLRKNSHQQYKTHLQNQNQYQSVQSPQNNNKRAASQQGKRKLSNWQVDHK